jgi:threonine synthase
MDISKSSNFERYACDLLRRDYAKVKALWTRLEREGAFDLSGTDDFKRVAETGFVSGSSTHAGRLATIRRMHEKYRVIIDPHTADGVKVGLEYRENGVPLVCLETAQAAKFAETIREALGREPERPKAFENLEKLPQRVEVMDASPDAVKSFIASHAG